MLTTFLLQWEGQLEEIQFTDCHVWRANCNPRFDGKALNLQYCSSVRVLKKRKIAKGGGGRNRDSCLQGGHTCMHVNVCTMNISSLIEMQTQVCGCAGVLVVVLQFLQMQAQVCG